MERIRHEFCDYNFFFYRILVLLLSSLGRRYKDQDLIVLDYFLNHFLPFPFGNLIRAWKFYQCPCTITSLNIERASWFSKRKPKTKHWSAALAPFKPAHRQ